MKQKNFSKVSSYKAKILPKCSWTALLVLVAFLFPAKAMAQTDYAITLPHSKVPAGVVYDIGDTPDWLKSVRGASDNFTVHFDSIRQWDGVWDGVTNGLGFLNQAIPGHTTPTQWLMVQKIKPGDTYQVTITIEADPTYYFVNQQAFLDAENIGLPASSQITNWGGDNAIEVQIVEDTPTKIVAIVGFRVPATIGTTAAVNPERDRILGALWIDPDAAVPTPTPQRLADSLRVGNLVPSMVMTSQNDEWRGNIRWEKNGGVLPLGERFFADSATYRLFVELWAQPGFTFIGVPAGPLGQDGPEVSDVSLGVATLAESGMSWNTARVWAGRDLTDPDDEGERASNLADSPFSASGNELAITLKAFSQIPEETVDWTKKVSAGIRPADVSGALGHAGWDGTGATGAWLNGNTGDPATYITAADLFSLNIMNILVGNYFLPDSTYAFRFSHFEASTVPVPPSNLPYGFFGLKDYYLPGLNIAKLESEDKSVWRSGPTPDWGYTHPAIGTEFNVDSVTITFTKTESNPLTGSFAVPLVPGTRVPFIGDTIKSTGIPGVWGAEVLDFQFSDGAFPAATLGGVFDYTGDDTIVAPGQFYHIALKFLTDDDHTFFLDGWINDGGWNRDLAAFTSKYYIGDSIAKVFSVPMGSLWEEDYYPDNFKNAYYYSSYLQATKRIIDGPIFGGASTEVRDAARAIPIPYPVAGMLVKDRSTLTTNNVSADTTAYKGTGGMLNGDGGAGLEFSTLWSRLDLANTQVLWYEVASNGNLTYVPETQYFKPNQRYAVRVVMAPKGDYTFYGVPGGLTGIKAMPITGTPSNPLTSLSTTNTDATAPQLFTGTTTYRENSDTLLFVFNGYTARPITAVTNTTPLTLSNFQGPVAGAVASTTAPAATRQFRFSSLAWFNDATGRPLGSTERFGADSTYHVVFTIYAGTNADTCRTMVSAGGASVTLRQPSFFSLSDTNGKTIPHNTAKESNSAITLTTNSVTVSYKFDKTYQAITNNVFEFNKECQDFNAPTFTDGLKVSTNRDLFADLLNPFPQAGDTLMVDKDEQFVAVVNRWEGRVAGSGAFPGPPGVPELLNQYVVPENEYLLVISIIPNDTLTTFGVTKNAAGDVIAYGEGDWFTYPAASGQVDSIKTFVNGPWMEALIYYAQPKETVTYLKGFQFPAEKVTAAIAPGESVLTADDVDVAKISLDGELHYDGDTIYLAGEDYTYFITMVAPDEDEWTLDNLKADTIGVVGLDPIDYLVVRDGLDVEISFTTDGFRFKPGYSIEIDVPIIGEEPATLAWIVDEDGNRVAPAATVSWSGDLDNGKFKKGVAYSTSLTFNTAALPAPYTGGSFYGLKEGIGPQCEFDIFNFPDWAILGLLVGNPTSTGVVTIHWPIASDGLRIEIEKITDVFQFAPLYFGYGAQTPLDLDLVNETANTFIVKQVVCDNTAAFTLTSLPAENDTINPAGVKKKWQIAPVAGLSGGNHSAGITVIYEDVAGNLFVATYTVKLQVYGVGIDLPKSAALNAFGENSVLTVQGLVAGEPFSVHNAQGILIYRGVAKASEATVSAPVKGVYIVTAGDQTLKVVNK